MITAVNRKMARRVEFFRVQRKTYPDLFDAVKLEGETGDANEEHVVRFKRFGAPV
jgi:hypothetical protein